MGWELSLVHFKNVLYLVVVVVVAGLQKWLQNVDVFFQAHFSITVSRGSPCCRVLVAATPLVECGVNSSRSTSASLRSTFAHLCSVLG